MAGSPALHGEPVSFDFIHLLRIEAAHFEVAFTIGGEDEVVLLSDDIPEVLHDGRLFVLRAVIVDEAAPEAPFLRFGRPVGRHAVKEAGDAVIPFEIAEEVLEGFIVRKDMEPFSNGKAVAGTDQDSVGLLDFSAIA